MLFKNVVQGMVRVAQDVTGDTCVFALQNVMSRVPNGSVPMTKAAVEKRINFVETVCIRAIYRNAVSNA